MKDEARFYEVEAETIRLRVGTLSVEHDRPGAGAGAAAGFPARVLFDGKPPPFDLTKLALVIDADGAVRVILDGTPGA